jgi:hypothetical protein
MNPIDKLTEPTFTNSAKGLMTLFCIGLAHMLLGVELTDAKIAIPWLPTINFTTPQNLIFIYWGVVLYSVYRYMLHNNTEFNVIRLHAFGSSLTKMMIGRFFVRRYITGPHSIWQVSISNSNEIYKVKLAIFDGEHSHSGLSFYYDKDGKFNYAESTHHIELGSEIFASKDSSTQQKWGFSESEFTDHNDTSYKRTYVFRSLLIRTMISLLTMLGTVRAILTSKKAFDFFLPIIFLSSLFAFWLYQHQIIVLTLI